MSSAALATGASTSKGALIPLRTAGRLGFWQGNSGFKDGFQIKSRTPQKETYRGNETDARASAIEFATL